MTKYPMTKQIRIPNDEPGQGHSGFVIRGFFVIGYFVIRHFY
jgi:hypothetical protein